MQVKTKFVEELNMMKVLATFLVVLGHVFINYRDGGLVKPYYGNDFFVSLCSYIYSFHMPRPLQNSLLKICSFHHIFVPL